MPVADYMALALGHPEHGYYMKGDPFGMPGDFITAPEISQVFGELIGLWSAVTWQQMGSPDRAVLVECGPGRGTLMSDLLTAAASVPGFVRSVEIHLVETSPALRSIQSKNLAGSEVTWHESVDTVPPGATILIANEFVDALPIRQVIRTDTGWCERCVGLSREALVFVDIPISDEGTDDLPRQAQSGSLFEICPAALDFIDKVSGRLAGNPGSSLIIDYGYDRMSSGDTLQAVRGHKITGPLISPGESDLTAHVNFSALSSRAAANGCQAFGPVSQAAFLRSLGVVERTKALLRNAGPNQVGNLQSGTHRLIDPNAMGTLFKSLAISSSGLGAPAGFEGTYPRKTTYAY